MMKRIEEGAPYKYQEPSSCPRQSFIGSKDGFGLQKKMDISSSMLTEIGMEGSKVHHLCKLEKVHHLSKLGIEISKAGLDKNHFSNP